MLGQVGSISIPMLMPTLRDSKPPSGERRSSWTWSWRTAQQPNLQEDSRFVEWTWRVNSTYSLQQGNIYLCLCLLVGSPVRCPHRLQPVDSQNWHVLRPTGLTSRVDRSNRSGLYSPNRIKVFCKESSCNPTREGVRLPLPINIKAKADWGYS